MNLNFHMEKDLWKLCQILPQFCFLLKLKISVLELKKPLPPPINKIWKANNSM